MFGKDPRVSCWKYDDWTPIWRVIKNVKNWHWRTDNIYHFLLIKSISRGFLQGARSVVSLLTYTKLFTYPFKTEIISACSRLLTDPASWASYVKRQQQHQLSCLQFWKQQKDIQIPIQSTWKKIFIGTRLHFKVQTFYPSAVHLPANWIFSSYMLCQIMHTKFFMFCNGHFKFVSNNSHIHIIHNPTSLSLSLL